MVNFGSIDYKNLSLLGFLLLVLWTILGLIFWGKLRIAISIRERNYFSTPARWNGDYETHIEFDGVDMVGGQVTQGKSIGFANIPSGCQAEKDELTLIDGTVVCQNKGWAVPPWIVEQDTVFGCSTRKGRLEDVDGKIMAEDISQTSIYSPTCVANADSCNLEKICMSVVPIDAFEAKSD